MAYVVEPSSDYPYFIFGDWADFETKVPDLNNRSEVASIFKNGRRALSPAEVPEILHLKKPYGQIPEIFKTQDGAIVTSGTMRDFIEDLDPGNHSFFPIKIDNLTDRTPRFILNVHVRQDSIIDEQSNVRSISMKPNDKSLMSVVFHSTRQKTIPRTGEVDISFNKRAMSGLNLWREARYPGFLFVSDVFFEKLRNKGIMFFSILKGEEL